MSQGPFSTYSTRRHRFPSLTALIVALSSLLFSSLASATSIADLPALSGLLIDHYDCRVAVFPAKGTFKELNFPLLTGLAGHQSMAVTLTDGDEKVVASVNSQMLQIEWTRSGVAVAQAQTMIMNSPSSAYVLIVVDPAGPDAQAHLNCSGVTFADVKRAQNAAKSGAPK